MATMSVSEARAALPEILDRVRAGEEITITRHGEPVAVVVRPDALRTRRADTALAAAQQVDDLLARGRSRPLPSRPALTTKRAEAILSDVRASRDRR